MLRSDVCCVSVCGTHVASTWHMLLRLLRPLSTLLVCAVLCSIVCSLTQHYASTLHHAHYASVLQECYERCVL